MGKRFWVSLALCLAGLLSLITLFKLGVNLDVNNALGNGNDWHARLGLNNIFKLWKDPNLVMKDPATGAPVVAHLGNIRGMKAGLVAVSALGIVSIIFCGIGILQGFTAFFSFNEEKSQKRLNGGVWVSFAMVLIVIATEIFANVYMMHILNKQYNGTFLNVGKLIGAIIVPLIGYDFIFSANKEGTTAVKKVPTWYEKLKKVAQK